MAKSKEKLKTQSLRRRGSSIKEIAKLLNVSVGSVSTWCKNITLTTAQIKNLQKRRTDPFYGKKLDYYLKKKKEFEGKVNNLKRQGRKTVGQLTKRDIFLIGIALYWAEGFKKDHQVGFANIDPDMIKFFLSWLNQCFNINHQDLILRVTANISYIHQVKKLERYWSNELNIPINQFSKPFFQKTLWKKQYKNSNNYHGVLRIKVRRSVDLLRQIYGFIEGISSNG